MLNLFIFLHTHYRAVGYPMQNVPRNRVIAIAGVVFGFKIAITDHFIPWFQFILDCSCAELQLVLTLKYCYFSLKILLLINEETG